MSALAPILALLLGCGPDPADDRASYQRALTGGADAIEACRAIRDTSMRGECLSAVGERLAAEGRAETAWAACEAIEPGPWKDECGFAVVDALGLEGPEAYAACERAGRFREFCVGHAVTRSIAAAQGLPLDPGDEVALEAAIRERVDAMAAPMDTKHRTTAIFTGTARHLADRWRDRPFDASECGAAPRDLCIRAYTETMRAREVERAAICSGEPTLEAVVAAGGTPWVEGSEPIVRAAWQALCVAQTGKGRGRAPGPPVPQRR